MRNPLLLAAAVALVSGCKTAPPPAQVPAERWIDEQIAFSASTLSQAQLRLHQTSPPLTPAPAATPVGSIPVKPPGSTAVSVPAQGAVAAIPTAAPVPKVVEVKPAAAATMPVAKIVAGMAPRKPVTAVSASAFGATAVPLQPGKAIPVTPVPPVVVAKATQPIKPLPEQWVIAASDTTLRRALNKWAVRAGWQLVWEASVDVPINVTASFEGDFRTAVKRLFQSLSAADVNLNGMLYAGNRVLRVTESGRRAQ